MIENDTTGMDRSAGRIFVRNLTFGRRKGMRDEI
jgi:hypothetical protein